MLRQQLQDKHAMVLGKDSTNTKKGGQRVAVNLGCVTVIVPLARHKQIANAVQDVVVVPVLMALVSGGENIFSYF
jgi:hypothetical protein